MMEMTLPGSPMRRKMTGSFFSGRGKSRRFIISICVLLLYAAPAAAQKGSIHSDVPAQPRSGARYLIYLHGRIVEEKGRRPADERFGTYEYQQILDSLAASGTEVISEQRPQGTDFREFGSRVADQVRRLIAAGVPPEQIVVAGFSKGGAIAIVASALLREPKVTFVFLGACGDWVKGRDDVNVRGRILSIYEASDELGTSCEPLFSQATEPGEHHEVRIATGAGHGAFYRPRAEWLAPLRALAQGCAASPAAVQILGSGGPRLNRERASSSYLVWIDGRARLLVDIGGGAFLRFGQAQAQLSDLSLIAISHLHPDHVSDLPALAWLSNLARKESLPIVGPSGNDLAPDFPTFLNRLFDAKNGAFQVLGTTLGAPAVAGVGGGVRLEVDVVDVAKAEPSTVFDRDGLTVTALGIPHGNIPTLAYRVKMRDVSIVFSSDQNGTNPSFVEFARGANVLVMHLAIGAGATSPLHAPPAVVGRIAQDAGVGRLIVSHIGEFDLEAAVAELKRSYTGPLTIGADMQCTPVR